MGTRCSLPAPVRPPPGLPPGEDSRHQQHAPSRFRPEILLPAHLAGKKKILLTWWRMRSEKWRWKDLGRSLEGSSSSVIWMQWFITTVLLAQPRSSRTWAVREDFSINLSELLEHTLAIPVTTQNLKTGLNNAENKLFMAVWSLHRSCDWLCTSFFHFADFFFCDSILFYFIISEKPVDFLMISQVGLWLCNFLPPCLKVRTIRQEVFCSFKLVIFILCHFSVTG